MKIQMLFAMNTEDDDEPLTREQWKKELNDIVKDIERYINRKQSTFVKEAVGEYILEGAGEGSFNFDRKNDELW